MFIHWALREIHLKLVYYGPGLGGKTANLKYIYSKIDPALKGDLVMLNSREDRTIFFDFLQLEVGQIDGKKPKFNLYTVPGQVHYNHTRKVVLNGVDGIVFVADSQREMMDANLDTLLDLEKQLVMQGKTLEEFPWVIQYNKRDLPSAMPIDEMEKKLNLYGVPFFEAVATGGQGVFSSLKAIIKQVVANVHSQLGQAERMRA
ncbi:GTPase domain-containing protein [candidate division KSB1 bacterium]|nr:GTPase domain-containing protein [candidate division KSB1 bacterium]